MSGKGRSRNEIRVLSPTAILGYGFPESSFRRGLSERPDVIAVDAGSTDPGPYYLGAGKCFVSRPQVARDLEFILAAGMTHRIPVIIGTAGGSGAKVHVDECLSIICNILFKLRHHPRLFVIYADINKSLIQKALRNGQVTSMPFVPNLTVDALRRTPRIVAQMGMEPIIKALDQGAQVIVCGRCYDPAVFAALPVHYGFDAGLALHMGKILECAAIAATPGSGSDCVMGILKRNAFILKPLSSVRRFTPDSVAAHTLYEKSDPIHLQGPGGCLDLSCTTFKPIGQRCVEVRGSQFIPDRDYTVKLEGVTPVGYRTVALCGIRDRIMIEQLDRILKAIKVEVQGHFDRRNHHLHFRVYGQNGVMGECEPIRHISGHEVGLVIDAVAATQNLANALCGLARSTLLHYGYPGRIATAGNLAFPFSPSDIPVGRVYEFSVYHLLHEDPNRLFPVNFLEY
jgi:hypothetical protein